MTMTREEMLETIVDLRMELLGYQIPAGYCPYHYLGRPKPCAESEKHFDCDSCRMNCFMELRKEIEKQYDIC